MIKSKIGILVSILMCILLIGCESSEPTRTGDWDVSEDRPFNIVNENIYRTMHYFETKMLADMRLEKPKEYQSIIDNMTEEEAIEKGKEYLPPDIKEINTTIIADGGIKEIEYTSIEGDFLITLVGTDNQLKNIVRLIISQKDINTYSDSSDKVYKAEDIVSLTNDLSSKSYASQINPVDRSISESIKYVEELLPDNTTEVSSEFDSEVGITSNIYSSGDLTFEVKYAHPENTSGYDLNNTVGIDINLIEIVKK